MSEAITPKYKIKGNESFGIREGWLNKGLTALEENITIFSEPEAMDSLGVGSKMVKSINDAHSTDWSYPLIVKPTDRSGSLGVTKVLTSDELTPAIEKA